jgi:hypothetical protein
MSDIEHWGSAHDRAELDAFITRGDDPEDGVDDDEDTDLVLPRAHACVLPALQEPGGPGWTCPGCGAQWSCNSLGQGIRLGMWQRTFAEQRR